MGKLISTSKRVISYFEREAQNPTMETVIKLSRILDIAPEKLLNPRNNLKKEQKAIRSLQKRLRVVHKLPVEDQKYIAKTIELIAEKNGVKFE